MKRNLIIIVTFVMSLILAAGCEGEQKLEEADLELTPYETVDNFQGVTMKIKEGSVSPTNLTVVFENNSDRQGLYGEGFVLEKNSENQWFVVPSNTDEYSIQDIGYDLEPKSVQE
ncbi:immunoglobulin-like domain-containing protein [Cytobacillus gottheilii]|uniref:immunoglobulin-like domain-containing protein n=1 Tax=Cytobacillus gottheilii TaxID=859144 RepID=UPI002494ABA2|nr:immunoglobulin-like domain-containing protein [Cytobacillus gottheilii]